MWFGVYIVDCCCYVKFFHMFIFGKRLLKVVVSIFLARVVQWFVCELPKLEIRVQFPACAFLVMFLKCFGLGFE